VRAIDAANNVDATPATRSFSIAPATPTPAWPPAAPQIGSPASYSWSKTSTLTFTGTAEAGSTVELFDDNTSLGTAVANAAGTWSRQVVNLSDGAHLISAKATNLKGTSAASAMRVIQIDTKAPTPPVFTAPASGSSVASTFTLRGTVEAGTTIEVFENGVSRGTTAASWDGTWSRETSGVSSGSRTYTAKATDLAGNVSTLSAGWTLQVR
jgi:hypothetical protein